MLTADLFFDLSTFTHNSLFTTSEPVWSGLVNLKEYMNKYNYPTLEHPLLVSGTPLTETLILHNGQLKTAEHIDITFGDSCKGKLIVKEQDTTLEGAAVIMAGSTLIGNQIAIGKGTLIESGAMVKSPTIIGDCCEVRQGAYIRGYCLAGNRCVLGHTTEIKHSILLNDAKCGHFNYLGDSILGNDTNLGAGTKFANLRFLPGNVQIKYDDNKIDSGLRKFGAILGDMTQTGCNSVTNPGTVFGKSCILMPNSTSPSGYHKNNSCV